MFSCLPSKLHLKSKLIISDSVLDWKWKWKADLLKPHPWVGWKTFILVHMSPSGKYWIHDLWVLVWHMHPSWWLCVLPACPLSYIWWGHLTGSCGLVICVSKAGQGFRNDTLRWHECQRAANLNPTSCIWNHPTKWGLCEWDSSN